MAKSKVTITLSAALLEWLKSEADSRALSVSTLIQLAAEDYKQKIDLQRGAGAAVVIRDDVG